VNRGSLECANWASVTCAPAICWSTWRGPADRSVVDGGSRSGTARAGSGVPGTGGGWSGDSGTTGLSTAFEVSGGAAVVVAISCAEASLPAPTCPCTSLFASSALLESPNLSASSRFFGARLAIASSTARMNAALSNSLGWAAFIFSAFAALPCACLSSAGGRAAAWAAPASVRAGGWLAATAFFLALMSFVSAANFGSACGPRRSGPAAPASTTAGRGWPAST
jgi:hypothetical protein